MNRFSLLLAATTALTGSGPNVRVMRHERALDDAEGNGEAEADPLSDITPAERAHVRQLRAERDHLLETMQALGLEDDGFYRSNGILPNMGCGKVKRAAPAPSTSPRVMPPKKEHPLSGVRTEAASKGPGKRTRAQRRADNARKIANAKRGSKELPASPINPKGLPTFKAVKPMPSDTRRSPFYENGFMGGGSYALRAVIKAVETVGHKLTGLYSSIGNENAVFKVFRGLGVASVSSNPHDFTVSLHHPMMGDRYEVHACDTAEQVVAVLKTVDDHVGWRPSKAGKQ